MERQILSQEEINALMNDDSDSMIEEIVAETDSLQSFQLSAIQKDALGEIGNISYGTASTALSKLVNKRVEINAPSVFTTTPKQMKVQFPNPYVLIEVGYKFGLRGENILIMKMRDAAIIADLMMGGDGTEPKDTLDEMGISAMTEAMNQMVGNATTSLSTMFAKRIEIDSPRISVVDFGDEEFSVKGIGPDEALAVVSFKLEIEGLIDSEVMLMFPHGFAVELIDMLLKTTETPSPVAVETQAPVKSSMATASAPAPAIQPQASFHSSQPQVAVQPAQFANIGQNKLSNENSNIGLILDVPLTVTVELGSTKMKIKDILELGLGSIVELDKLAGDPVDIFVNGKLIAKGEVMVIDENFGIKVTDVVSQLERANTLQ